MSEIVYYVDRDDESTTLEITGCCSEYVAANFRGHPDNWTPEEGGDCEIEEIIDEATGEPWEGRLTATEKRDVLKALAERSEQEAAEAETERAVDAYEYSMYDSVHDYGIYGYEG